MQKELGRYLLPVLRKKYNTVRHSKKYPPKSSNDRFRLDLVVNEVEFKLRESFPDPIRTIRSADSSGAYRVGESGYAGFIVHIKVKFMNGFTIDLKV